MGVWACGVSRELGHGLALKVVVAVGPDRCGLTVCVVLVSFSKKVLRRGLASFPSQVLILYNTSYIEHM